MKSIALRLTSLKIAIFLCASIAVFTLLCGNWINQLYEKGYSIEPQDMASINQAIWNTSQGRPLQATILYEGVRDHLEPVLLFYSLNYLFGGSVKTLFYLHSFLISLGVLPLFFLARYRSITAGDAVPAALSFLLLPPMHSMIFDNYLRPDILYFPVMALLVYAMAVSSRKWLLLALVLTVFVKESGALILVGAGFYYGFILRQKRMGGALILIGAAWFVLVNAVYLPLVLGGAPQHVRFTRFLPTIRSVKMFFSLAWPPLAICLVAWLLARRRWEAVTVLPQTALLLFFRVKLRYWASVIAFSFALTFDEMCRLPRAGLRRILLFAMLAVFVLINGVSGTWGRLEYRGDIAEAQPLMDLVPPDADLCTEKRLLPHFSTRYRVYQFNRSPYFKGTGRSYIDAEYFLLHRTMKERLSLYRRRHLERAGAFDELHLLDLQEIGSSGAWVLYRRRGGRAFHPAENRMSKGTKPIRENGELLPSPSARII